MDIKSYDSMMNWLTRPANTKSITGGPKLSNVPVRKPTALPPKTKTIQKFSKGGKTENSKMLDYVDTTVAMYEPENATKEQKKKLEKKLSKQEEYDIYFNKKSPKYYNRKIAKAPKPTPNGQTTLTSEDWNLLINSFDEFPYESFDDSWMKSKKVGILEQDLANEYWQEQYENYLNNGGTLSYQQFMQQQLNMKVSKEINKRVKDKQRTEGIAAILGTGRKI